MFLLEKREIHPIFKNYWLPWQPKQVFDENNSRNPKKEALQAFENLGKTEGVLWRVTHNNCFLIEQR